MKKTIAAFIFGIASLVASTHASAAFVSIDWKTEGDSKAFYDDEAGLEWMRLSPTLGMSINDVMDMLATDSDYQGWRIAVSTEVRGLFDTLYPNIDAASAGGIKTWSTNYTGGAYWAFSGKYTPFVSLFGWTDIRSEGYGNRDDYYTSYSFYLNDGTSSSSSDVLMAGVRYIRDQTGSNARHYTYYASIYEDYVGSNYQMDFSNSRVAVYLVSDGGYSLNPATAYMRASAAAVPAPATLALMGIGLGVMILRRKKLK